MKGLNAVDHTGVVVKASIFGGIIILIGVAIAITSYTATDKNIIEPDEGSRSRLTTLSEVMNSILGRNWPFVLLFIIILFALILVLLFLAWRHTPVELDIPESHAKGIHFTLLIIAAIFGITMILLAIRAYRNYQTDTETGNVSQYQPTIDERKKTKNVIILIGITLTVMVVIALFLYNSFLKRKNNKGKTKPKQKKK